MSERRRPSVSPPSSAKAKRRCEDADDDTEIKLSLVCLICSGLVVDAVQTPCCGRLHCRACITKWLKYPTSKSACSQCRATIDPLDLIKDVQCERLSAAKMRSCPFAENGCPFVANRLTMRDHEHVCECIPHSVLREQRDSAIKERALERSKMETRNLATQHALRKQVQRLLMSGLGPNPAIDCLKAAYGFDSVIVITRDSIRNRSHGCMDANWVRRVGIQLEIKESNFNVSAVWRRAAAIEDAPHSVVAHTRHLVHPRCSLLSRTLFISKRQQEQLKMDGITGMPHASHCRLPQRDTSQESST